MQDLVALTMIVRKILKATASSLSTGIFSLPLYLQNKRSSNLGMLELDLIIGTWAKENIPNLSEEECEKYSTQVIAKETPDLYKLVIGIDKKNFKIEEYDEYVRKLREYAESNDKVLRKK